MPLPSPAIHAITAPLADPDLRTLRDRTTPPRQHPRDKRVLMHRAALSRSIPWATTNDFVPGHGKQLRIGIRRKQLHSIADSRSQWHPHGVASSDQCGLDRNRSAARHVSEDAVFANANRNPEFEQRVQAVGVVATCISSNVACSMVGTDDAWVLRA